MKKSIFDSDPIFRKLLNRLRSKEHGLIHVVIVAFLYVSMPVILIGCPSAIRCYVFPTDGVQAFQLLQGIFVLESLILVLCVVTVFLMRLSIGSECPDDVVSKNKLREAKCDEGASSPKGSNDEQ